jgi:2-C-methyl-D-erythritol 4-phosphate cytidylyltransferase
MQVTAVVLAAGKGQRLGFQFSKPLIKIDSRPLITYCLNIFNKHPDIKDIIIVANKNNLKNILSLVKRYKINKIKNIILGGKRRQDSVLCGLKEATSDFVLIHDAARPFLNQKSISLVIKEAKKSGAAILGVPVKATVKEVTSHQSPVTSCIVKSTLNRENLWEAQTPQVFKKDLILKAYHKFSKSLFTDDASLVEKLGRKVKLVMGSYLNIKVTTPEDLILAKAILRKSKIKNQNPK